MTEIDHSGEHDRAVAVLHPLIEGVGRGGRCRWQSHTLCPAYHQAQIAADELRTHGLLVTSPGAWQARHGEVEPLRDDHSLRVRLLELIEKGDTRTLDAIDEPAVLLDDLRDLLNPPRESGEVS